MTCRSSRGGAARAVLPVLLVLLGSAPARARAAEPPPSASVEGRLLFDVHGEDEGLSSLSPLVLLQDRVGFLWVGTGDGLFRFDGRSFVRWGVKEGLPDARITALHQTPAGVLWAGTRAGLARLDGLRFAAVPASAGLPRATVHAIASDGHGTLFVATARGLYLTISDRFHVDARTDGFPETAVTALATAPDGGLLIGRDGRLFRRDGGHTKEHGFPIGLPALERIDDVAADGAGGVWVRGGGQLFVLAKGAERFRPAPLPSGAEIGSGPLALGPGGRVVVPTSRGAWLDDGERLVRLGRSDGLPGEVVLSALGDRDGSLWLGLNGIGLVRRAGTGAVRHWGPEDGLPEGAVFYAVRLRSGPGAGTIWAGTASGLSRVGGDGRARPPAGAETLPDGPVLSVVPAPDGAVWVAAWGGGVFRFDPAGSAPRRYGAAGLAPAEFSVLALLAPPSGEVWAVGRLGVHVLRKGAREFVRADVPGGTGADVVQDVVSAPDGSVWAASRAGLLRLSPSPRRFGTPDGLPTATLVAVATMPDGTLLVVGASGGLHRFRPEGEALARVPLPPGAARLPARLVALGAAADGTIWAGGDGLYRVRPDAPEPDRIGRRDGLPSADVVPNSLRVDPDGGVLFGTTRGLARCDPALLGPPPPPPAVAFTSAFAGSRPLPLDRPAVLSSDERELKVSWSALSFAGSSQTRFRVRVAPLDAAPSETSASELLLKALPAGEYRLEVTALPPGGGAGPEPAALGFEVTPKLTETLAFRLLGLLLAAAALYGVVKLRTRALEAQLAQLTEKVGDQDLALARKEKDLEEAALTDALTGVRNRAFFQKSIGEDVDRSVRAYAPFATPAQRRAGDLVFYFVEVDHLERVNEAHGFAAGDRVLSEAVERMKGFVRSSDYLVRWGGRSFLVVTRASGRERGDVLASRILSALSASPLTLEDGTELLLTASVGWAPFPWLTDAPGDVPYEDVLRLADRALQTAKDEGGNRAVGVFAPGPALADGAEAHLQAAGSLSEADGKTVRLVRTSNPEAS